MDESLQPSQPSQPSQPFDWRKYPQEGMAHPDRPWWSWRTIGSTQGSRLTSIYGYWQRDDGRKTAQFSWSWRDEIKDWFEAVCAAALADLGQVDAAHPLPPPPMAPGQVWVHPFGVRCVLVAVAPGRLLPGDPELYFPVPPNGEDRLRCYFFVREEDPWPPPGARLVDGDGAPWEWMGLEEDASPRDSSVAGSGGEDDELVEGLHIHGNLSVHLHDESDEGTPGGDS